MFVEFFHLSSSMGCRGPCLWKSHCSRLRTGSNPVETSGDDSSCVSDTHHMWFIILRLACPRQIGLCIFSDSPIHIHGTRLWWHIGLMKVFPVFVSRFKGLDGYLHWRRDTGSTSGANPLQPHLRPPEALPRVSIPENHQPGSTN